ncbi:YdeI/OmpD-associated family protein [Tellurirhabdus bombi]|uniref:YdeI/OmpD-associated family protein n=1 Tax=Tellurirhabdus bombi TaxID=2907205 RepID=UPI001F39E256|nr:YdeI/OmpD-associated family protein [Tellurirhabdus bombi]
MTPTFFTTQSELRAWFMENHEKETELLVGFYKVGAGKASITWSESVDEAICFGWIDGVRRSIDETSYMIRFTPRKAKSIWSAVNIKKVQDLSSLGLMAPAGLAAFEKREESKSKVYSFEQDSVQLDAIAEATFRQNEAAWTWFNTQAPSYRKAAIWWVMSAKQEVTKQKRLTELIQDSEERVRLKQFSRTTASK